MVTSLDGQRHDNGRVTSHTASRPRTSCSTVLRRDAAEGVPVFEVLRQARPSDDTMVRSGQCARQSVTTTLPLAWRPAWNLTASRILPTG
jgi:hypothetical protein